MHKRNQGFTIVELLIVIVVIAILAAISMVAYTGIQKRANNAARVSEAVQVMKAIEAYKALNGSYPDFTNGANLCVGTGFPNGKCNLYKDPGYSYLESNQEATQMLAEVATMPSSHIPVGNSVGPVIASWNDGWGFSLVLFFQGEDAEGGPCKLVNRGFTVWWNDPNSDTIKCGVDYVADSQSST